MEKKVIFLDIDGTLRGFDGVIPESTKEAIRLARANGHETVVCSGRSLYQIDKSILDLGFDGIIGQPDAKGFAVPGPIGFFGQKAAVASAADYRDVAVRVHFQCIK